MINEPGDNGDPVSNASWREYRRLVLAELERLNRTIKEESASLRHMMELRIGEIKTDSIAVLRQEQTQSQLDRLKLWEEMKRVDGQISRWKGGAGVIAFVVGGAVSGAISFVVNHLWK